MLNYAKEIREFVVKNFLYGEEGSLQENTSFLDNGVVDSTGILELILFLEKTYRITIEPEDMTPQNLDSIEKVAGFVQAKQKAAGGNGKSEIRTERGDVPLE
ncbi:MAG TPA: acyl carrier protein [Verrucomicrobiae bacterium]|nr:acyl carrier protein [Verrucomicrobiae bacterium]